MKAVLKVESISGKLENSKTVRGASAMSNSCCQVFTSLCIHVSGHKKLNLLDRQERM